MITIILAEHDHQAGMKKLGEVGSGVEEHAGAGINGHGPAPRGAEQAERLLPFGCALPTFTASAATLESEPSTRIRSCADSTRLQAVASSPRGSTDPDPGSAGDERLEKRGVGEDLAHDGEVLGVVEHVVAGPVSWVRPGE